MLARKRGILGGQIEVGETRTFSGCVLMSNTGLDHSNVSKDMEIWGIKKIVWSQLQAFHVPL